MFKLGISVANSQVVVEAARQMKASEKLEKEEKEQVKRNTENLPVGQGKAKEVTKGWYQRER